MYVCIHICIYVLYVYMYICIYGCFHLIPDRPVIGDKIKRCHRWRHLVLALGPTHPRYCLLMDRTILGSWRAAQKNRPKAKRILFGGSRINL